jgi:iron complex outermembrane recepter protein
MAEPKPEMNQILVIATRLRGALDVPQPPIATLDEAEIAAYGAASIADLLAALTPQTGSGRGRGDGIPVILVNGQRIASFREMRNFPPEAIRKVEVLPEEVALRFGYPPDQRVVNFILKDNFRSRTAEIKFGLPTRGGFSTSALEGSLLKINGSSRLSVTGSTDDTTPLYESERGVIQAVVPVSGSPNPADYRTLIADSRNFGLNVSWSTGLGKDGKSGLFSLNGNATHADSRSGSGLDALTAPLERISHITNLSGGAALNTNIGQWQFAATADATHGQNETLIDRFAGTGVDQAISNTERLTSLFTLTGRALRLPAGALSMTIKAGYNWSNIDSRDTRSTGTATNLTRGRAFTGINFAIPLTSGRERVLGAVGDITLNFSAGYDRLSDFGQLTDWSAGLTWAPTGRLGFQASYIVSDAAPSLSQLGNPQTQTFNVPLYDFTTGQSVLVTIIGGGNPSLVKERQHDLKLSTNWQLPVLRGSSLLVEYFRNRSANVSAGFPLLTPAIEAAFPGRVVRDLSGRIISIDQRPVTLAQQRGSRLRWGLNLSGMIGKAPVGGANFGGGRPRGGGGRAGGGGMGGMGAMFGGQGRWNIGLFHTYRLSEQVLIAPDGPLLDLLDGDALIGGGVARHTVELESGFFNKGLGVRLAGRYSAPTTINGSGLPGSSDLRFSGLFGFDLRLFADLGQKQALTRLSPFFKGARLSFRINNIFDARQRVTDGTGAVPLSYQRDYVDPRGRVIEIELRKMF